MNVLQDLEDFLEDPSAGNELQKKIICKMCVKTRKMIKHRGPQIKQLKRPALKSCHYQYIDQNKYSSHRI